MTTNWRKIEDTLPKPMTAVLACAYLQEFETWNIAVAYLQQDNDGGRKWTITNNAGTTYGKDTFTHWMPLPEPPEGDND